MTREEKILGTSAFLGLFTGLIGYCLDEPKEGEKYFGVIKRGNSKKTFGAIAIVSAAYLGYMHYKDLKSRKG